MSKPVPILEINDLSVAFPGRGRATSGGRTRQPFSRILGEIVAVIGESGSGKTITALAVLGLLPRKARIEYGAIRLKGRSLLDLPDRSRREILGDRIAFIPQDALRALNPTLTIGDQVGEPLVLHRKMGWTEARRRAVDLLRHVHIKQPELRAREYPHEFSGGMQQRAMIAMGIALEPELLIADEPTTALDVTVQAQVIASTSRDPRQARHIDSVHHPRSRAGRRFLRPRLCHVCGSCRRRRSGAADL